MQPTDIVAVNGDGVTGDEGRANWYPDPLGRYDHRFHNGRAWTADVSRGGVRFVDPLGVTTPPAPPPNDARATAALVLGVIGVTLAWIPFLFVAGVVCAIVAIVLGLVARRGPAHDPRAFALAGVVTGGAALALAVAGVVLTVKTIHAIRDYTDPPAHQVALMGCEIVDGAIHVGGTLRNDGSRASSYRVEVLVSSPTLRDRTVVLTTDDVAPGETAELAGSSASRSPASSTSGDESDTTTATCVVHDVTGPLPFGIDVNFGTG